MNLSPVSLHSPIDTTKKTLGKIKPKFPKWGEGRDGPLIGKNSLYMNLDYWHTLCGNDEEARFGTLKRIQF